MFKKFFIFILLILCFPIFSKNLLIYINNLEGFPVENAYITVDKEIKKTDVNGFAEFVTEKKVVSVLVEKSPYKSRQIMANVSENTNLSIELKESYDFYFNLYEDSSLNYQFSGSSLEKTTIKESIISIYKNGVLVDTLDYSGKDFGVDLKKGDYTLVVYTFFSSPYVIENLKFDPKKSPYLNISIPLKTYDVSGTISNFTTLLGAVNISFKDNSRTFKTSSSIEGAYSVNIPAGIYGLTMEKIGYTPIKKTITINGNINNLSEQMTEIPSILKGRITDARGNGISNKNINIKNNGKNLVVKTDNKGYYEAKVYSGLAFIKIDIPGFFPTGRVEKIDTLSTKDVGELILKERLSSLSGTITTGILPISGVFVKLFDENNYYFGMTKSDAKGYFSFEEIKSGIKYYLLIDDSNYSFYKSNFFINEDNQNTNFTIILNNNDLNFVLELKTDKNFDYSSLSVYINNIKFQPDKNGVINETIKSLKKIDNLNIEIPKLGIKSTYKTSDLGEKPYLLTIKF